MCGEKCIKHRDSRVRVGITPACAGKRWEQRYQTFSPEDHPRMCGEKVLPDLGFCLGLGSPPHVRGKDHFEFLT